MTTSNEKVLAALQTAMEAEMTGSIFIITLPQQLKTRKARKRLNDLRKRSCSISTI